MKFRNKIIMFFFFGFLWLSCSKTETPPNVVIILTDDQGWGDIASHGNPDIDTPNLDVLADAGARFDRFFVSPVCAPTRASLLTGRDHLRTGTQWVTYGLENMSAEEVTFGEVFKEAGYKTGLFGKWHNGSHYPMDPNGQGFETFFGFKQGHWNNYFDTELEYNGNPVQTKGFITDVLTDSALAFIEKNQNVPFLTFIPYNAPHSPFQVPDQYFDKYKSLGLDDKNASIYGMVENIDDNVGRIINRLDELNLSENTIVIFLTDNGPNGGDRYNGNMKGWKAKVDEGGVRVPLFIKWPAKIRPGTEIKELTAHIDFLPSLVELAGISSPETKPLDGKSFAPLLLDEELEWEDRFLFTHQSRWDSLEMYPASVRNNQYRAVRYGENWELYDMNEDPGQRTDISGIELELTGQFAEEYDNWFAEVTKNLPDSRPIPVGYDISRITELPAVEAQIHGDLQFQGESGWSNDWLKNWNDHSSYAMWELDVISEGTYEFSIEYALIEKNIKSELRVLINKSEKELESIVPAHYAEVVPSPDRVVRGEVYEKKWGNHIIGDLLLQKGIQRIQMKIAETQNEFELKSLIIKKLN